MMIRRIMFLAYAAVFGIRLIRPNMKITLSPEKIDRLISSRESFELKKDDVSTTVGMLEGREAGLPERVLVKRFNYKGFLHFLWRLITGSRAENQYRTSMELKTKGLPVPEPFAYINASLGQRRSYYLSSVIENAVSLALIDTETRKELTSMFAEEIAKWHSAGAVHGDMKWTNILLKDKGLFFIDLDGTKMKKKPDMAGIERDLARFYRGGLSNNAEDWVEKEFFPVYMEKVSPEIREKLDIRRIMDRAVRDWKRKGSRRNRA